MWTHNIFVLSDCLAACEGYSRNLKAVCYIVSFVIRKFGMAGLIVDFELPHLCGVSTFVQCVPPPPSSRYQFWLLIVGTLVFLLHIDFMELFWDCGNLLELPKSMKQQGVSYSAFTIHVCLY